jgi:hypothetical protein
MSDQPSEHVPGQLAGDNGDLTSPAAPAPADDPAVDDSAPAPEPASDVPYDDSYVIPDQAEQDALTALVPDDPEPSSPGDDG